MPEALTVRRQLKDSYNTAQVEVTQSDHRQSNITEGLPSLRNHHRHKD